MSDLIDNLKFEKRTELLLQVEIKWFNIKIPSEPSEFEPFKNYNVINKLKEYGRQVYEQDVANYETFREKTRRSDHNWIKQVLRTGTINDRINANCILLQDSAVHNLKHLDSLLAMVKINKKRECLLATDALKDLFINYLLPNRQLKNFNEHAFDKLKSLTNGDKDTFDRMTLMWYFESVLKTKYIQFIKSIQDVFQDTIAATKVKLSGTISDLLVSNKYEQEKYLIEILTNKLGDPDYEVASKILYQIKRLLQKRPKKKLMLLLELERLVTRQNITEKAQYYGLCSMNQILLTKQDTDAANRLILIYFAFFKKFIKSKEIDSRMLNAILTGVNRAYKYAKMDNAEIDNNLNTLFKLVHVTTFNVSIQALMFLNQIIDSREDMMHRYYNALYRKMFDLEVKNTSKQKYFLNLLFNSINKDEAIPRIKAFVKRLLQISLNQNVPFISGALILLSELAKSKKNIFQFENNLLVSSNAALTGTSTSVDNEDDDGEEKFVDVKTESSDEEEAAIESQKGVKRKADGNGKAAAVVGEEAKSWIHKKNIIHKTHDKYDYTQRNPLYSGADKTLTYELMLYSRHYHPTVSLFANKLINDEYINYSGDPLSDFTIIHFLDRFVYKNPKKTNEKSSKQKKSVFGSRLLTKANNINSIPVNSKEYLNIDYKEIPEDEKFFYQYFKKQQTKKGDIDEASDVESISDTEFDDFLIKTEDDGGLNDQETWTLDVAEALKKEAKNKKGKKRNDSVSDDDDDDDDDEDLDEEDDDGEDGGFMNDDDEFGDDEDFAEAMKAEGLGVDDEDDEDNSDEENEDDYDDVFVDKSSKAVGKKKKSNGKHDISGLFASAEEFDDILNETAEHNSKGVGSISNNDKSDVKQLKWELSRENSSRNNKFSRHGKKPFNKKNGKKSNGSGGGSYGARNKKSNLSKPKSKPFKKAKPQKNRKKSKKMK